MVEVYCRRCFKKYGKMEDHLLIDHSCYAWLFFGLFFIIGLVGLYFSTGVIDKLVFSLTILYGMIILVTSKRRSD